MIYIFAFILCTYFASLVTIRKKGKKVFDKKLEAIFVGLTFLPLFVLYAFRGDVGIDHYAYEEIFKASQYVNLKELTSLSDHIEIETFFLFVNYLGAKWNLGITFVYFVCSALTFLFTYKAITYYDRDRTYFIVSIIIFYSQIFFSGLDAVRQMVAICIYFYSTKYIVERKLLWFLVWIFIASLFHSSVFVMILTYFILPIRINPFVYLILSLSSLVFSQVFTPSIFIEYIAQILPNWKYLSDISNDVQYSETIGLVYFIHLITAFFFLITKIKGKERAFSKNNVIINMYALYVMLYPLISQFLSTKRLLYYLFIGICVAIPIGLNQFKGSKLSKFRIPLLVLYCLLFIFLFISSVKSGYSNPEWFHEPYKFFYE
ncbi:EpsG family protein [Priestia endophytica]|uniref:EpsG family protein n=1 Tax=Priestia endophytica TaxID=135735 RepID=UPI000F52CBA5|nr:EpsG family protein [Priestia endophytica]RPK15250.1 hypothetical protein FH5_00685 [Priestia endophytica]